MEKSGEEGEEVLREGSFKEVFDLKGGEETRREVSMAFSEWKKPNFLAFFFSVIFLKNSVLSE